MRHSSPTRKATFGWFTTPGQARHRVIPMESAACASTWSHLKVIGLSPPDQLIPLSHYPDISGTRHSLAPFTWATGIEDTFIKHPRPGLRSLDEYELTQHYQLWKNDLDLVAATGVQAVRWGIPWHIVQPAKYKWDWEWTDRVLEYLVMVKGITPILDLMHYGTPLWLDNSFINQAIPNMWQSTQPLSSGATNPLFVITHRSMNRWSMPK